MVRIKSSENDFHRTLYSVCNGGTWSCTKKHCSRTCAVTGTNHIQTFDGKNYGVRGSCEYILVQVKFNFFL